MNIESDVTNIRKLDKKIDNPFELWTKWFSYLIELRMNNKQVNEDLVCYYLIEAFDEIMDVGGVEYL